MKKLFLITACLALALMAGCADGKITPAESVLTACQTYNGLLMTAARLNSAGALSAKQTAAVDKSIAMTTGLCEGDAPNVDATALDIASVEAANLVLDAITKGE